MEEAKKSLSKNSYEKFPLLFTSLAFRNIKPYTKPPFVPESVFGIETVNLGYWRFSPPLSSEAVVCAVWRPPRKPSPQTISLLGHLIEQNSRPKRPKPASNDPNIDVRHFPCLEILIQLRSGTDRHTEFSTFQRGRGGIRKEVCT